MFRPSTRKAQIILETALVMVALAALAVGATRIFATMNNTLLERNQLYRQSRQQVVNELAPSLSGVNPEYFLDYPNGGINIPALGDLGNPEDMISEPRLEEADRQIQKMQQIIDYVLKEKINAAYRNLVSAYHLGRTEKSRLKVEEAKELNQQAINKAVGAYYRVGKAIELLQSILDNPNPKGPFDLASVPPGKQYRGLRKSIGLSRKRLERYIKNLKSTQEPLKSLLYGIYNKKNELVFEGIIPRLRRVRSNINWALGHWYTCTDKSFYKAIRDARNELKNLIDELGEAEKIADDDARENIEEAWGLLSASDISKTEALKAKEDCVNMLNSRAIARDSALTKFVQDAIQNLDEASNNWEKASLRRLYLRKAQLALEPLHEAIS
jgi:hypothetical protein